MDGRRDVSLSVNRDYLLKIKTRGQTYAAATGMNSDKSRANNITSKVAKVQNRSRGASIPV